jgi:hypothetical protein
VPEVTSSGRKIHPHIVNFERADVRPAPDADFLWLHGVIANLDPALFLRFHVGQKVGRTLSVGGHYAFEQPWQVLSAHILAVLLAIRIKVVACGSVCLPLHLPCDFFGKVIGERKGSVRERHVQFVLFGEKQKLVRFDGVRRDRFKPPIPMEYRSEDDAIRGISEWIVPSVSVMCTASRTMLTFSARADFEASIDGAESAFQTVAVEAGAGVCPATGITAKIDTTARKLILLSMVGLPQARGK